ncbi:MAG TPA: endonuclease/exonuclease/phosphatase [Cytophagales bacterium]|jgi:endonuclease/exonuclease/phosphatase family metal-dependent hydrolase|nr:endonuclease/exonuclease/phosphatase [Cytophagales bacterium]
MRYILTLILAFILSAPAQSQVIRAMTYNIRFDNPADGRDQWADRKMDVVKLINEYEPDIIGTQEGLKHQLDYLVDAMPQYHYLGVGRDDGEQAGEYTAILYKKYLYKVLKSGTFWLSETPGEVSKGWDAALPRICTYILLQHKTSKKRFWVFNTHFDHVGKNARSESAYLIWEKIQELNKKGLPVVLTGDFNLSPNEAPIEFLSDKMTDTYNEDTENAEWGTFNGFQHDKRHRRRIDYVFINEQFKTVHSAILINQYDKRFPSDHMPVIADLEFQ